MIDYLDADKSPQVTSVLRGHRGASPQPTCCVAAGEVTDVVSENKYTAIKECKHMDSGTQQRNGGMQT